MFEGIKGAIGPRIGLAGLTLKKYSPEIYLTAGVGAGIASVVMIARAHKKSDEVFEDVRQGIDSVHNDIDRYNDQATEDNRKAETMGVVHRKQLISTSEERKQLTPLYGEMVRRAVILYGPGILMGVSAIALILASHSVQKRRNRALLSALTLFERGFSEYRKRVVNELGAEADERFYYGAESRKITTLIKDEDGNTKKIKGKKNHIPDEPTPIIYQRVFDQTNPLWRNDPDMNEFMLRAIQSQMNDLYYINGYLMLNTVYKSLGFAESPEGAIVGWSTKVPGDDFISIGLDHSINAREGDDRWFLDFNVNGSVFEHIGE
jgi:hypothetical protein